MGAVYTIATYNIGQAFDYKQLLLRNGLNSVDPVIKRLYHSIKLDYDSAVEAFNRDTRPKKGFHPKFIVNSEELNVFKDARREKLKGVIEKMRNTCAIVLLQEVTSLDELELIKKEFNEDFDFSYKVSEDSEKQQTVDTLVAWNKKLFKRVCEAKNDTPNIKQTSVVLQDLANNTIIHATSLHATGYSLVKPISKYTQRGDAVVQNIIEVFNKNCVNHTLHFSFVGGDFNSRKRPGMDSITQKRFTLLEEVGFKSVPHGMHTAFNDEIAEINFGDGTVDLDHLFVKDGLVTPKINLLTSEEFSYPLEDPSRNPSDHRPLFFSIELM